MVKLIPRLVHANLSLGIDEDSGHVGELTVEQVVLAATTSFDRAVQVHSCLFCHAALQCISQSWPTFFPHSLLFL